MARQLVRTQYPYNIESLRFLIGKAAIYKKEVKPRLSVPKYKHQLRKMYEEAFLCMYAYIHKRIMRKQEIPEHCTRDVLHDIMRYLTGGKEPFFEKCNRIMGQEGTMRNKFFEIQRLLDNYIWCFWYQWTHKEESNSIIADDLIDPQLCKDWSRQLDPEQIAVKKCEQDAFIQKLLTAPDFCRIKKERYEKFVKIYLRSFYGKLEFNKVYNNPKLKFYGDYVLYCLRRVIKESNMTIEDIYELDSVSYGSEPTFLIKLAKALDIEDPFITEPKLRDALNRKKDGYGYEEYQQSKAEYKSYERNHKKLFVSD